MLNWIKFFVLTPTFLFVSFGFGQSIWTNPITGTNPNTSNPYTTGDVFDANISVSGIGRGAGINGTNANDRYNANGWNTPTIDLDAYFEWTLTPNLGCEIDFTSFVYTSQRSDNSIDNFALRSSVDGFVSDIGAPVFNGTTINLSAGAYQNINSAITFRFYAWGAGASGNTFSINSFTFNGTTLCGPPSTNTITTSGISSTSFSVDCDTDDTGTVNFTSVGTFNAGNVFTVQLSDELGSFASPLVIGSLSGAGAEGVDPGGIIDITIPAGTTQGNAYRVRVICSNPATIGTNNGSDITINSEVCPSQLPASQGLLINEFSNGATNEQEYYEFIVAGRCGETVDVRGYIIDDNNGTFTTDFSAPAGSGIAAGHLRLTNHVQWSNIPVGSLIVVYNEDDPNSSLPVDDPFDSDNDSLYVIPHTFSDLVEINTTIPNATAPADSNYTPATYGSTSWTALNIRNAGDAIQVRTPNGTYFHGVSYGGTEISGGPNNMKIFNSGMGGMCGWFNSGDVFDASNWSTGDVAGNETPGLPNNAANLAWLRLMRDPLTSVCPVTPLPITLENFSGYYNGSSSELSWQTLSEQNNDYFALYHSTNGKTFDRIGKVPGSGNTSTLLDYSFEHRTPHPGINYYKLKSVDYDGTVHDKGIIAVQVEMNHVFYDQITQSIQMNYSSDYAVYGSDGRLITRVANQNAIPFSGHGVFHVIDERSGKAFKLGVW
jgi:hypothetical protein